MIIAVTGSAGFVGRRLVQRLLEEKHRVIELDIVSGIDIKDYRQLSGIEPFDLLYHLAAATFVPDSFNKPQEFYATNVLGTLNALEICRRHHARMIFISSYIYGVPQHLPIDENHPVFALNPYTLSKIIGEKLCRGYHQDFGLQVTIIRPFNIYGPGQKASFLIPTILSQAALGRVTLKDPEPRRDYLYVDDAVDFYTRALKAPGLGNFDIFNIGSGESHSVRDIVRMIQEMSTNEFQVSFSQERRPGEIMDTVADITKATVRFDWKPMTNMKTGLELTMKDRR